MLGGSNQMRQIRTNATTYCIQRSAPYVMTPVHLDKVRPEVFRYIGIRIWTITIRCDAVR